MLENRNVMAANIRRYMSENNKSRHQICKDLDIPYSTFSEWISAKKYPRIDKIELMANYFGCEKSDLIEEKTKKPAEITFDGLSTAKKELLEKVMQMSDEELQRLNLLLQVVEAK